MLRNKVPSLHNPQGLKLLTRLRLDLSHLCDHEFKHYFLDTIVLSVVVALILKRHAIYFVYCPNFLEERATLLS